MADGLCCVPRMAVEGATRSVWSVRIAAARSAPVVGELATVVWDEEPRERTGGRAGVSTVGRACVSTGARAGAVSAGRGVEMVGEDTRRELASAGRGVEMVAENTPRELASGRARTPGDRVTCITPDSVGARPRMWPNSWVTTVNRSIRPGAGVEPVDQPQPAAVRSIQISPTSY